VLLTNGEWIEVGKGIATLLVALLAALIAWQQVRAARNKLKADLFDRRFAAYDAIVQGMVLVGHLKQLDSAIFGKVHTAVSAAEWLFDEKLLRLLRTDLLLPLFSAYAVVIQAESPIPVEETPLMTRQRLDAFAAIKRSHPLIVQAFSPYLKLKH
jgi:hypothetical protein